MIGDFRITSGQPIEFLTSYISYARSHIHPVISVPAAEELVKAYVEMRKLGEDVRAAERRITATTRQLESMIRLSEAHAKMRLSEEVTEEDVREAVRLIKSAIKESATDPVSIPYKVLRDIPNYYRLPVVLILTFSAVPRLPTGVVTRISRLLCWLSLTSSHAVEMVCVTVRLLRSCKSSQVSLRRRASLPKRSGRSSKRARLWLLGMDRGGRLGGWWVCCSSICGEPTILRAFTRSRFRRSNTSI